MEASFWRRYIWYSGAFLYTMGQAASSKLLIVKRSRYIHDTKGQNFGRDIWAGTISSTNIVRLSRRCVDKVWALVHVIATDASHKCSAEWALHHSF